MASKTTKRANNRPTTGLSELINEAVRAVPIPPPVLSNDQEADLSDRQRELLEQLGTIFQAGFANLTMADLADQLNCSLRTLYLLASSRNQLVTMVIDRTLRDHGRAAQTAMTSAGSVIEALQGFLVAANDAVSEVNPNFATDMSEIAEGAALNEAHSSYLIAVTKALLTLAIERGELASVDTAALARMLGGLGRDFARPEVLPTLDNTPAQSANAMVSLVINAAQLSGRP